LRTIDGGFNEIKIARFLRLKKYGCLFVNFEVWARIRPSNFSPNLARLTTL